MDFAGPSDARGHRAQRVAERSLSAVSDVAGALRTVAGTGLVRPQRPDRPLRALLAARRLGASAATPAAAGAVLYPDRIAVIDERGELTFAELWDRAGALAGALAARHRIGPGKKLGLLGRNHRGLLEAVLAGALSGADLVLLNTDFAAPQLAEVLDREGVDLVICDDEFTPLFEASGHAVERLLAWKGEDGAEGDVDALIALGHDPPPAPEEPGQLVLLTSGSTGTPKGAPRNLGGDSAVPMLPSVISTLARLRPVPRSGEPWVVAPPLYHAFGFAGALGALGFGSPVVMRRRFDAEETIASIAATRAGVLFAVPTMLKRIMDLPEEARRTHDCSSLRMALAGAAPLSPQLASSFMDAYGDILFNGYGSTEVGLGSLATPADMRAAPGTIGQAAPGTIIRILGDDGRELPRGEVGRIFVGSPSMFEGYTGGGTKELIDGLMSTGDLGHMDTAGRLFIDGRDDDMIVSGGENVFPQEVEELIAAHPDVVDAAAVGVPDEAFGQRLVAFAVVKDGATVSADELRDLVKARLARYKVPRSVEFIDAMPRNPTGKLQRKKLAALVQSQT